MRSRVAFRPLVVCVSLLFAACSREPVNPEVEAAVHSFDERLASLDQWREKLGGPRAANADRDFRGRTIQDDLDQWVLSAATRRDIQALRKQALEAHYLADAQQLLTQANRRADDDVARAKFIWEYWNANLPVPYWRRYWRALFAANGVPEETPDSMLVAIEGRMAKSLDAGDFKNAARAADELDPVFSEALNRAADRIFKQVDKRTDFAPRKTPCARGKVRPGGARATLVHGEAIEAFYPEDALKRGERGTVVMRAQINAAGCGTGALVQVHSGVPALDAAALSWFETASFTPASERGVAIESILNWKMRFELRAAPPEAPK
jgi:TonB family protein